MTDDDIKMSDLRATSLGYAMSVLVQTERRSFRLGSLYAWLMPPIRLGQFVVLKDAAGRSVGFATWAYLTEDVAQKMLAEDPPSIPLSDWNEGTQLWIIEFAAVSGHTRALARLLRDRHAKTSSAVRFVRRNRRDALGSPRVLRAGARAAP